MAQLNSSNKKEIGADGKTGIVRLYKSDAQLVMILCTFLEWEKND